MPGLDYAQLKVELFRIERCRADSGSINLSGIGLSSGRLMLSSVSCDRGTNTRGLSGVGYGTLHMK